MIPQSTIPGVSSLVPILALSGALGASALTISVNFHVGDDGANQADHELTGSESAGIDGNTSWNNVNVGNGATNAAAAQIFATTTLADDGGNSSAATLSSTLTNSATAATWFVGYAASQASLKGELSNGISDDNLFNSYLALNGAHGDGTPQDNFQLTISGLGTNFTTNGYNVIIYSDSDRRNTGSNVRRSEFLVTPSGGSGTTVFVEDDDPATTPNIFNGTYLLSDNSETGADYSNYTIVSGLTASGFTIDIESPDGGRGAISGFQIVAIPEPSTIGLLGFGLLGLGLRRRR
ncbi:PEP-CTERM sorting domain-containing protein [Haloferula rosea]|uniref:PEP-CTERM sorting domain-containing protein n=1 Tax=Haloferula rosea TaxID=490093 RepID=A0A934VEH8_9BACT|nr:PEP-CTERM sorting domain-containing protein [Haloferula rosea]MBK1827329.1 PEP-CTERM sorting domain-containing protein [Haloferula rosea]